MNVSAGAGAGAGAPSDPVLAALGALGRPVDLTGTREAPLEGPLVLWLVAAGALDLFAVDAARQGHRHFLGRLPAGTLLLGPAPGPSHTLVTRPLPGSRLHRVELRELHPAAYEAAYHAGGGWPSPVEEAFAQGIGRGLRVLYQAPLGGGEDDILWPSIPPGSVQYGGDGTLLMAPGVWRGMVDQQRRLLHALDGWIGELERAHEDRTAAGIKAGEAARTEANQALLAAIGRTSRTRGAGADVDATLAACRLVAADAGIALTDRPPAPSDDASTGPSAGPSAGTSAGTDPIEAIAVASHVRTRRVRLTGHWWRENGGPLVGRRAADGAPVALLWHRGRYVAADPATDERQPVDRATAADLEPDAVLLYRPLPDRPLDLPRLIRFSLRGTRRELRDLAVGGLVAAGLGALVPIATGQVLGEFVPRGETGLIVQAGVAVVAIAVVAAVFMLLQNTAVLRMAGRVEATLQPAVWDRLLRLPATFFSGRSTGELASAAMGVSAIRRVLAGIGSTCLQATTIGAANLVLLLVYSVPLALVALAMLATVATLFLTLGLWQLRYQRRLVIIGNRLNNQAFQTLRALPKLRVAAAESFAYAAWAREFARTRDLQQRAGRIANTITVLNAVCLPVCTLVMFMLLAGPARGSLSAAEFLTFHTAATMLLSAATQLTGALLSAAAVLPMFEQVRPILQAVPEVTTGADTQPAPLTGHLEARAVSYRYAEGAPLVLDDVDFEARPGEFVAVVGPSGCGKSTLLRLLIGFDDPLTGSVRYDGQELAALDRAAVRRQCGVVLQNAAPLTGSLLDCIRGTGSYTLEEAWQAAALAGLAEDIKAMPMGMHTILSDGGSTVSGGQRQRLMIAQALIRRPRILFFDEATSALDNEAQRVVTAATRALRATRIVIAHRLSTVMDADRVLVMSEGRIVQQGPPAALLADHTGLFHELVRRQMA
ncbi:NHLP bacteriocin export ABC transporter permease/ATPase subunit [Streptomyces hainanensis]|uniref:NHLP bacteriocin export ABC transporter permease/ATPase subunit n=1 Tax=Streptomyces hainanensis TaxID=402648 RepID=A0A4R4SSP2_9ACTN|nr:NHLP bacteriocin export ABC transporter permease/ATPase subunit [Streptomyces hainanensis]TDC64833.1 NHLP bacteriocin export ABC transporter permease/ATPase subunit [Streptomyces hainanensis]